MAAIAVNEPVATTLTADTQQLYTLPTGASHVLVQNVTGSPATVKVAFSGTDGSTTDLVHAFDVPAASVPLRLPFPGRDRNVFLWSTGAATIVIGRG